MEIIVRVMKPLSSEDRQKFVALGCRETPFLQYEFIDIYSAEVNDGGEALKHLSCVEAVEPMPMYGI